MTHVRAWLSSCAVVGMRSQPAAMRSAFGEALGLSSAADALSESERTAMVANARPPQSSPPRTEMCRRRFTSANRPDASA